MKEPEVFQSLAKLIQSDLKLDEPLANGDIGSEQQLIESLKKIINYLLDHDFERLLQALYRIDVSETIVKKLLATAAPDQLSDELSKAILEREQKKLEIRIKYGGQ